MIEGESLIGTIFSKKLEIPDNQRPYEWDNDLLEKFNQSLLGFIEDIYLYNLKKEEERKRLNVKSDLPNWYLGAMIFFDKKGDKKKLAVVDGQQRILTFTIFSLILDKVVKESRKDNGSKWKILCSRDNGFGLLLDALTKIGKEGMKNISFSTPTLNQRMSEMFKELANFSFDKEKLKQNENIPRYNGDGRNAISKKLVFIHKLITYGEDSFMNSLNKYFENWSQDARSDENNNRESFDDRFEDLNNLYSTFIKDNILITDIITRNELEGYMLYEDFNSKRKALSSDSLIKNYIFKKLHSDEGLRIEAAKIWDNTIKSLDDNDNLSMREYVRYFWNSRRKFARERNLYNLFAEEIDGDFEPDNLTQNIWIEHWYKHLNDYLPLLSNQTMKEIYALNPNDENYDPDKKEFVKVSFRLGILKAKTWVPAALSILNTDKDDKWKIALKLAELAEKTFTMISILDDSPASYEPLFSRFAWNEYQYSESDISRNSFINEKGIFQDDSNIESRIDKLQKEIFTKLDLTTRYSVFEDKIKNKPLGESAAKCVLFKYVQDLWKDDDLGNLNLDKQFTQLEHIHPKKAKIADWPGWAKDDEELEHLGNLILLTANPNKVGGNKPYKEKLAVYSKYLTVGKTYIDWCINEGIVNSDKTFKIDWTPQHVKKRSEYIWSKVKGYYKLD